jgi:3-hydroxyisobutyrate dehydrogenase-like beta-hydroxyacid dehydrogenase
MGSHIGRRLRDAGHELIVWNRTASRAEAFAAGAGATVAQSARQAAERSSIILSSVSDDAALRELMLGADGALAAARPGKTFVETSSVLPETQREIARVALKMGAAYVDAPISGSTPQIDQATAIVLAGGDAATIEGLRPILATFSKSVLHFGDIGSGATMKLCVNILLAFGMQAVAEATALGTRAGLDRDALLDGLAQMAVISPAAKMKIENVRKNSYPETFPVVHMAKDLRLALELAERVGVDLPATKSTAAQYSRAAEERAGSDFSVIVAHAR